MTILSDKEIKEHIGRGELILNGDVSQAQQCAYHCRTGKIFKTGPEGEVIDWDSGSDPGFVKILPGEMIWVRTRVNVKMPANICAFWWQTNSLSRKGLMLINMSMVEPGYEGPLACLFVNFGKESILLYPENVIAKLVFVRLNGDVDRPLEVTKTTPAYDQEIHDAANIAPTSFLQMAEFSDQLVRDRNSAIESIKSAASEAKEKELDKLREDTPKVIRRSLGFAIGGFAILVAATMFVPWVQSFFTPDLSTVIDGKVEKALAKKLILEVGQQKNTPSSLTAGDASKWASDLRDQMQAISDRLERLEQGPQGQ